MYREPPDPSKMKLDFSHFHPLDHPLSKCADYPGGKRTHLHYKWEFFTKPWLRRHTTCLIGLHRRVQAWNPSKKVTWESCSFCSKRMSENQPY